VDLRIDGGRCACLHSLKRIERFPMKPRRIDALAGRQIESQFAQPLLELTARTYRIGALAMIETDRKVNEGLQEKSPRPNLPCPVLFQYFVALEIFAVVEEPDSPLQ